MKERYNHKYMHCEGKRCEMREDCIHYLAYCEAMDLQMRNVTVQERCEDVTQDYVRVRIEKV